MISLTNVDGKALCVSFFVQALSQQLMDWDLYLSPKKRPVWLMKVSAFLLYNLLMITLVYDSRTTRWTSTGDKPSTHLYTRVLYFLSPGKPNMPQMTLLFIWFQASSQSCFHLPPSFTSTYPSVTGTRLRYDDSIGRIRTSSTWMFMLCRPKVYKSLRTCQHF